MKNLETRILKAEERSASDRRVGGTEDEGMILLLVERGGFSPLACASDQRAGGTEDECMILLSVEREGFSLLAFLSSALSVLCCYVIICVVQHSLH